MVGDEVFQAQESHLPETLALVDAHEPRQHLRHFEARELLLARTRVAHPHGEVERKPGDVGEGVRRVDGERHQHGEDLLREDLAHLNLVRLVELIPGGDRDARRLERGQHQFAVRLGVAHLEFVRHLGDVGEHVLRGAPDVRRDGEAGGDAALEAGDPDHEELVEVAGEDRKEVGALQDRQQRILRQLEHALVEREPAQLSVEVAVVGQRWIRLVDEGGEVVVEVAAQAAAQPVVE